MDDRVMKLKLTQYEVKWLIEAVGRVYRANEAMAREYAEMDNSSGMIDKLSEILLDG